MDRNVIFATFLFLGFGSVSLGQGFSGRGKSGPLLAAPESLPDVIAYTEKGEEFPLRERLKGHHAVIVFGCLT